MHHEQNSTSFMSITRHKIALCGICFSLVVFQVAAVQVGPGMAGSRSASASKAKAKAHAAAVATELPTSATPLTGAVKSTMEAQCATAALSAVDPKNAGVEVRRDGVPTVVPGTLAGMSIVDWYRGELPRRSVAMLAGTQSDRLVQIKVTVEIQGKLCRLASWRVVG